jgi:hypothetical protein
MKLHVVALVALVFAPFTQASAQVTTSPGDASVRIYNWCMDRPDGTPGECGCVAGFYAGATEDDAFRLIARLVEHLTFDGGITDPDAMSAALVEEANAQSITSDRFNAIMEDFGTFDQLGEKADTICVPLKGEIEAPADE